MFLSMNCSFIQVITFGLIASTINSVFSITLLEMYMSNLIYFVVFCYYSKILLKSMNQKIEKLLNQNILINGLKVTNILRNIDVLYRQVMSYNEIWSVFVLINWIHLAVLEGQYCITLVLANNIYVKFIMCLGCIFIFSYIALIVVFCSFVVFEAKKTHKLLIRLNASKRIQIFSKHKIKVRIH